MKLGRREVPDAAAGDHFWRETRQAQRRKNEGPQDRERQQVPRFSPHQGKKKLDPEVAAV